MDLCVLKDMNLKWQVDYSCWKKTQNRSHWECPLPASTCVHKRSWRVAGPAAMSGQRSWVTGSVGLIIRSGDVDFLSELNGGFNGHIKALSCSGGWFGTCFIFPYIGNFIIPTDEVSFFRGVGIPPTSVGFCLLQAAWTLHVIFTSMGRVYGRL